MARVWCTFCVYLLLFVLRSQSLPTCSNPTDGANKTCPMSSQCWDSAKTATAVIWSLYDQCQSCTFPQQNPVIVQNETVTLDTDGTFQRDQELVIYKVSDGTAFRDCDISGSTGILGDILPTGSPLDVTTSLTYGANFFISFHVGGSDSDPIPGNCEQGAKLIVYKGKFECGNVMSPCSDVAPCVFHQDSSIFKCQCPAGFIGTECQDIDECFQNAACGNPAFQGACVDGDCDFSCNCLAGHSSSSGDNKKCDVEPVDCSSTPCQNGGTCTESGGSITCECLIGFDSDMFCANIDECATSPCHNGGTCIDAVDSFSCSCPSGYTGSVCSINVDDCSPTPCLNSGTCMDDLNDATCSCSSPWTGKFCQVHEDDCLTAMCLNNAICVDGTFNHSCSCAAGFTGPVCETNINECTSSPCQNAGVCTDEINQYSCMCLDGFTGSNCETNIDECASDPCQNDGTCQDFVNGYLCSCQLGFTGTHCKTLEKKCDSNPCLNGGTCNNNIGGYLCECVLGFTGTNCETNVNECASNPCENDGTCEDELNQYACNCPDGFTGLVCQTNINECASNPCQNAGVCTDGTNQYQCDCPDGFTGSNCETNIDECASTPCQHDGTCEDLVNAFNCSCSRGFIGKLCEIEEIECNSNPCLNGGTCNDGIGGYQCECALGFIGINCETNTNECASSPCLNGGTCSDLVDSFSCECASGFTGRQCETNIDECSSFPCRNGGACHDGISHFDCVCVPGFSGTLCQTDIDECMLLSNPCQNNGTCVDMVNAYHCSCVPGYTGTNCETEIDECLSSPCQHDGTCYDLLNQYKCVCVPGFTGVNCETEIDECVSKPCQNGAICLNGLNRYDCRCVPGFTGINCDQNVKECASNPCQNGGTCEEHAIGILRCHCPPGFTGDLCETNIDECASNPCLNGGTCHDGNNQYTCECTSEFNGTHCEIIIDACKIFTPCKNQGTCINVPTSVGDVGVVDFSIPPTNNTDIHDAYVCICTERYTGRVCETFIPVPPPPPLVPPVPNRIIGPPPPLFPPPPNTAIGPPPPLFPPPPRDFDCSSVIQQCLNGGICISAGSVENGFCSCPFGFGGRQCENDLNIVIPGFGDTAPSSLQVSGTLTPDIDDTVVLSVRRLSSSGLVFFVAENTNGLGDFIALFLIDSKPVFKFDLGFGAATIVSPQPIPFGVFTNIELRRNGQTGSLVIDDVVVASGSAPGDKEIADLMDNFYVGGVPNATAIINPAVTPLTGFVGCVRSASLDGTEFDLVERAISGVNVGECPGDPCSSNPCQNGGSCSPTGSLPSNFECTCLDGFGGSMCEVLSVCHVSMPCMHGGECRVDSNATVGYRCICTATHIGPQCETAVGDTAMDYAYAGDSYIVWNVNNDDVVDTTVISLRVYPYHERPSGILALLFRPSLDFLAVVVDNGFVRAVVDLGQGSRLLTSNLRLIANKFSTITVNRLGQDIDLTMSGGSTVSGTTPGTFSQLNVDNHFFIGGVPPQVVPLLPYIESEGFTGCIDDVTINGKFLNSSDLFSSFNAKHCNVDLCNPSPCQNNGNCSSTGNSVYCSCPPEFTGRYCESVDDPCQSVTCASGATCIQLGGIPSCACPLGKIGEQCEEAVVIDVPSFSDDITSFISFLPLLWINVGMHTVISISVKPLERDGLIFYWSLKDSPPNSDFIALGLHDGFVEFRYNLGSGTAEIKSAERIDLYRWHTIHAERNGKNGFLTVDGGSPESKTSPGSSSLLDVALDIYVGGHEDYTLVAPDAGLTRGFTGCINGTQVNNMTLLISSARGGRNVYECEQHPCDLLGCKNGGVCTDVDGLGTYVCVCPTGFIGDTCQTSIVEICTSGSDLCHNDSQCIVNPNVGTFECFCPLVPDPRGGEFCDEINHFMMAKFKGNSFATYTHALSSSQTKITFRILPQATNGLVIYLQSRTVRDFLAVGIIGGNLELRYDLGTGSVSIRNPVNVTGTWHTVSVLREHARGYLVVDNETVTDSSPGSSTLLNMIPPYVYVGGIAVNSTDLYQYRNILDGDFHMGLEGCIADLEVNDVAIDLEKDANDGANVDSCDDD